MNWCARSLNIIRNTGASLLACTLVFSWAVNGAVADAGNQVLVWRADAQRVDARIESWSLEQVLQKIAEAAGWQIYVEPDTRHTVSARFRDLPINEALGRLLGNLSYALLPQTNAAPKLFVFRTSMQEATQLVNLAPPKTNSSARIANELVVILKPNGKSDIDELARQLGAKILGRSDELHAYRLQFDDASDADAARAILEANPDVSGVDSNYTVAYPSRTDALSLSSTLPLNLKAANGKGSHQLVIGLVDTPIQPQAASLADFVLSSLSVAGKADPADNAPTHGTSMAETILRGLALASQPSDGSPVRILPVDVYGNNTATTTFDVANGIYAAVKGGANIVNLSLGGPGDSTLLHQVIQESYQQGVLFVASAGNEPSTAPVYPAAYPEVLATTAGDKNGNIAPYANRGSFVAAVAPGTSVIDFNNQTYLVSGTSASAAYVSGLAAGLASGSGKSLTAVATEIRQNLSPNSSRAP
ncbi:MAG: S8 family serine peptidase [Candidatus Omnitrophica bacterium]|nr:S8 family serine peptidase [Candidatus Omnitrophota bacterium]